MIQSLWLRSDLNTMGRLCIRSFQAHGHEFHLYIYGDVAGVPEGTVIRDGREIMPPPEECLWIPDQSLWGEFFSYNLLLKRGGWSVNMDMVCLKPLDFKEEHVLPGEYNPEPPATRVNGNAFKAPEGSPIVQRLLDKCHVTDLSHSYWGMLGPELITSTVAELGIENLVKPPQFFNPVPHTWVPQFISPDADFSRWNLDEAYCLHWWAGGWLQRGYDLDGMYPADCLYERMKARYL